MIKIKKIDTKSTHQTPAGISIFPKLIEADTKFDAAGLFSVRMKFSSEDEVKLVDKLDAMYESAYAWNCENEGKKLKRADKPWKEDEDGDGLVFNFKRKASGVRADGTSWTRQPPMIFDADGIPVSELQRTTLRIGSGSEMIVIFKVIPFYTTLVGAGISLCLEAVQLLKVVDFKKDAAFYGLTKQSGWKLKPEKPIGGDIPEYRGEPDEYAPTDHEMLEA